MTQSRAVRPSTEAISRRWLAGALALAAAFWLVDLGMLGAGVPDTLDDTWEYGVAARHVLAGEGFRTTVVHPPLWSLRDPATGTVPVLVHGPLVPILVAPLVALGGPRGLDGIAWLAALAALGAAWAIARLGTRHLGAPVGAAAALSWTLSPLTLRAVHHDVALPLGAFLLALSVDLAARERPRSLAAGLALGAGALVRPEFLLAALPVAALARGGGWRVVLATALLVWAPWGVHTWRATGSPIFNLSSYLLVGYWGRWPGISVLRDFSLAPAQWPGTLREALPALPAKWLDYAPHALKRALLSPTGATGWLALVGLGAGLATPRRRRFAVVALALACVPVAIMTLTLYDSRYLVPFLPLWALGVAWGAERASALLPAWGRRPRTWMGLLALLVLPALAPEVRTAATEAPQLRVRLAGARRALAPLALERGTPASRARLLFTDRPDFAAWSTGRTCVWLEPREWERLPAAGPGDTASRTSVPAMPSRADGVAVWLAGTR